MRRFLAKPLPRRTKKSKKTDKCIVSGYRPKAGVVDQGTTNLVCRRHEFGMGHLRDPAACYLDSTLSEYRRLRPRQKRFLFFLRFSSQDFPVKRDVEKQIFQTRCRTTSPTLTTVRVSAPVRGVSRGVGRWEKPALSRQKPGRKPAAPPLRDCSRRA